MQVDFTPEQSALVQQAIDSGRLRRPEDAAQEAFSLRAERERRRTQILLAVDKAEASLAQRKGRTVKSPEASRQLAEDIERRGIARLSADQIAPLVRITTVKLL